MTFFTTNVVNYIGDNEWLWYFVTGNGGSEPVYSVKSVSRTGKDTARAIITVRQKWEDGTCAEEDASEEYEKYRESAEDLKEYVPDFQARVKDFYAKYGG